MDFPFSIYVYAAPHRPGDRPRWDEVLRANNQSWAIYAAGLLHNAGVPYQDTVRERPVVKAVRYGITFDLALFTNLLQNHALIGYGTVLDIAERRLQIAPPSGLLQSV
jgi:hypothetical protein